MVILIIYNEKPVIATLIEDYKVSISQEDAGIAGMVVGNDPIELDQCQTCGKWCSLDDDLYGDGYCAGCACMCFHCEQYFNGMDMYKISDTESCCTDCYDKHYPNLKKYVKAIRDLEDIDIEKRDVRVSVEYIGEGKSGDYTKEENDIPLMRFYILKKEYVSGGNGTDHPDWNWVEVDNGSCCTQIPVDTPNDLLNKFAQIVLERVVEYIKDNDSIKHLSEEFSWADADWIKKQK